MTAEPSPTPTGAVAYQPARLTPEERQMRRSALGASEVAAVLGLSPNRGPLDVWMTKDKPSRGALVVDDGTSAGPEAEVGQFLEQGLLALYSHRTGIEVVRGRTTRHPSKPWAIATPDGLAVREDRGCECKVVGSWMADHWTEDDVPDYVFVQSAWCMAITGRRYWDVVALLDGTDLRVYSIARDQALEDMLLSEAEAWWTTYVDGDLEPPTEDPEEKLRYLRQRYGQSKGHRVRLANGDAITEAARRLAAVKAEIKALERQETALENVLCEAIGDDYGLRGEWGSFLWVPNPGAPHWKSIALELSGGKVPPEIVARHRGQGFRTPQLHPPPKTATRSRVRGTNENDFGEAEAHHG